MYTKEETQERCERLFLDIPNIYSQQEVNWRGTVKGFPNLYYTEVLSDYLLQRLSEFKNGFTMITRSESYRQDTHMGDINSTNRQEENIAKTMFINHFTHPEFGEIFDYQVPLKDNTSDGCGKIDLVSRKIDTVYLLELKRKDCQDQTMLRCVLEIYTYIKQLNHSKFLKDYNLSEDTLIKAAPLIFKDSLPYREYMDSENHPKLRELMEKLNIIPFFLEADEI